MNAYELEIIQATLHSQGELIKKQADRIAELEKQGNPVAWIRSGDDQLSLIKEKNDGYMQWTPLYTHPHKELSDEEIQKLIDNFPIIFSPQDLLAFAKAIIKASRGEE